MVLKKVFCVVMMPSLVLAGVMKPESHGNEWDYEGEHGPSHWSIDYPMCGGSHQSPISISTKHVEYDSNLKNIQLHEYNSIFNVNMSLTNNGHTVQVDLKEQNMSVSGGGLQGTYKTEQFHFHWGSVDRRGSEHDFDGVHYPMEMHIVHYSDQYANLKEAMDKERGLMVLAFLFEVGSDEYHNDHFYEIISHFDEIAHKDDHVNIPSIPLASLIPNIDDLTHYYRYEGSLTTPPCYESVVWTVFKKPIRVTKAQLEAFRHKVKKTANGEPEKDLSDDFRPAQPINDRIVYSSLPVPRDGASKRPDNSANRQTLFDSFTNTVLLLILHQIYSVL